MLFFLASLSCAQYVATPAPYTASAVSKATSYAAATSTATPTPTSYAAPVKATSYAAPVKPTPYVYSVVKTTVKPSPTPVPCEKNSTVPVVPASYENSTVPAKGNSTQVYTSAQSGSVAALILMALAL